jgi:NADH dehydrogenase
MILVVGATGLLGGRIAQQLLQDGQTVRILVRPGSAYPPLVAAGAQPVLGDLKQPASLPAALAGVETVITTASAGQRSGADTVESVDVLGNRHLIDAALQAGVRQFIFVSTVGADPAAPVPMMQAKGQTEVYLRASGLGYTILQPNGLLDVWVPLVVGLPLQQQRPVVLIGESRRRHSFVTVQDVAAFARAAIGHPAAQHQTLLIGGPAAITWRAIIAAVEAALGRPLEVERRAPGEMLPGLPPLVSELMAAQETYDSPIDMGMLVQSFGVRLTSLEEWARVTFAPMLLNAAAQAARP